MTVKELHWLAGFFDGEASFTFYKNRCQVDVGQKDPWPLLKIQRILGFGQIYKVIKRSTGVMYLRWNYSGKRAAALMMTLYPLLSPRRQARIAENLAKWRVRPLRGKARGLLATCWKGHKFTPQNTFVHISGGVTRRHCRLCQRLRQAEYRSKQLDKPDISA